MAAFSDTICAPATPAGAGAITVIRVSGPSALDIADKVVSFRRGSAASSKGYSLKFGSILDAAGEVVDEVLVSVFKAPASYTGEDGVEISCHASSFIVSQLLSLLCAAGCRMALPGEFTQRAFVNGKMDLSQAEAVADVIASRSAAAHRVAMNQMRGGYSDELRGLRDRLVELSALLELELDFSEEEVEFADREKLRELADRACVHCRRLADSFKLGNAVKNGVPVAIVGAPNSGKSTLLNALIGDDRAIVSPIAGTTRDTVEETCVLGGVLLRFVDTAGIRASEDLVEKLGIERTFKEMSRASVVLGVVDGTLQPFEQRAAAREIAARVYGVSEVSGVSGAGGSSKAACASGGVSDAGIPSGCGQRLIIVRSKADVVCAAPLPSRDALAECRLGVSEGIASVVSGGQGVIGARVAGAAKCEVPIINISAANGLGMDELRDAIVTAVDLPSSGETLVTNARHAAALSEAAGSLSHVLDGLRLGIPGDLLAEDLRAAIASLSGILGEQISADEILGEIFGKFCIGK